MWAKSFLNENRKENELKHVFGLYFEQFDRYTITNMNCALVCLWKFHNASIWISKWKQQMRITMKKYIYHVPTIWIYFRSSWFSNGPHTKFIHTKVLAVLSHRFKPKSDQMPKYDQFSQWFISKTILIWIICWLWLVIFLLLLFLYLNNSHWIWVY